MQEVTVVSVRQAGLGAAVRLASNASSAREQAGCATSLTVTLAKVVGDQAKSPVTCADAPRAMALVRFALLTVLAIVAQLVVALVLFSFFQNYFNCTFLFF